MDTEKVTNHFWWDYYRRGSARMHKKDFGRAAEDFERCLGLRKGALYPHAHDMWKAKTYGLHFLNDYFPNRELGICRYHMDNLEGALESLENSIDQQPSARAAFYLNLARGKTVKDRPIPLPSITMDTIQTDVWTSKHDWLVSGTAHSEAYIHSVVINGNPQQSELAEKRVTFRQPVALVEGTNEIRIAVRDLAGREATKELRVLADFSPPVLSLQEAEREKGRWNTEALCVDNGRLSSVELVRGDGSVEHRNLETPANRTSFSLSLALDEAVTLRITDEAGNTLESRVSGPKESARTEQIADAGEGLTGANQRPPVIALGIGSFTRVCRPEIWIDGVARDPRGISGVSLQGHEFSIPRHNLPVSFHFALRQPLEVGTNTIVCTASGASGETTQTITAQRKEPEYLDRKFRLATVMTPVLSPSHSYPLEQIRHLVEKELLREPIRLFLLDRDQGWKQVQDEIRLCISDVADSRAAVRIGKLLPADLTLMGMLLPQPGGATIYAALMDTETGELLFHEDVYSESIMDELDSVTRGLALKIEQRFPVVTGTVSASGGKRNSIDVGSEKGIWPGMRFLVLPGNEEREDEAGVPKTFDGRNVELCVTHVENDSSFFRISPGRAAGLVRHGDMVYPR